MSILSRLWPRPRALPVTDALPVRDSAAGQGDLRETLSGFGTSWNPKTGQGSERDPIEYEQLRGAFIPPDAYQIDTLLRTCGLARRIVSIPPTWCTLHADESWSLIDSSRQAKPLQATANHLGLANVVYRAHNAARELGNAGVWMMVEEHGRFDLDAQRYPIDPRAVTGVRCLQVVAKDELTPKEDQKLIGAVPPFGDTLLWEVRLKRRAGTSAPVLVHASRLVLFSGAPVGRSPWVMPLYGWGDESILVAAIASIQTRGRARRGRDRAADRFMQYAARIVMPEAGTPEDQMAAIESRWSFFRWMSSLGVFLIDAGKDGERAAEEIIPLHAPLAGLADLTAAAWEDIAADCDRPIPLPLIMGREASGLGTGSWLDAWYQDCGAVQKTTYTPRLRPIYDVLYWANGIYNPDYTIAYKPLKTLDGIQRAEERLKVIQGWREAVDAGFLSRATVARSAFGAEGWSEELQPAVAGEQVEAPKTAAPLAIRASTDPAVKALAAAPTATEPAPEAVADLALNGAQIEALLSILERVAAGQLTREGAVTTITTALPLVSAVRARQIVEGVVVGQTATVEGGSTIASDASWSGAGLLWLPVPETERVARLQRAVASLVPLEGYDPGDPMPATHHVTALWCGPVDRAAIAQVEERAPGCRSGPLPLVPVRLTAFDRDEWGRQPIVVELHTAGLRRLHDRLIRACAPAIGAEQYPTYRPHITLGFVRGMTDQQWAQVQMMRLEEDYGEAVALVFSVSDRERTRWALE